MDACLRDWLEKEKKSIVSVSNWLFVDDLGSQEIHDKNKNEDGWALGETYRKIFISAYLYGNKIMLALHIEITNNNTAS